MSTEDFKCPECGTWLVDGYYCDNDDCDYEKERKEEIKKIKKDDVNGKK